MYMTEDTNNKWKDVIEHPDLPEIKDPYRRDVTRRLLENQEQYLAEAAPANSAGAMADTGGVAKWDPILISLVRRAMPQMIAYDVCGVQPMTGPTGLIFAMHSKYTAQAAGVTNEALFDEADTDFSGTGTHDAITDANDTNPFDGTLANWTTGAGNTTATGEALGDAGGNQNAALSHAFGESSGKDLTDMKLHHWKKYMRSLGGQHANAQVNDIFRDNTDDYQQESGGNTWLLSGTNIYRPSGYVGIGTSVPSHALDIVGNSNISGKLNIGGTLSVKGSTNLSGGLTVKGNTNLTGKLSIGGRTDLGSTLSVGGATTMAAITGTSLNLGDGNITNVGDINCDSISVDAAGTGLNIEFGVKPSCT